MESIDSASQTDEESLAKFHHLEKELRLPNKYEPEERDIWFKELPQQARTQLRYSATRDSSWSAGEQILDTDPLEHGIKKRDTQSIISR